MIKESFVESITVVLVFSGPVSLVIEPSSQVSTMKSAIEMKRMTG